MVYDLIITDRADELVDNIVSYLKNKLKNPDAALRFVDELDAVYGNLEENPFRYPESQDQYLSRKGYREALLQGMSYRIVFRIDEFTIYIVGVYHDLEDYGKKIEE
jgi:plasmid stabilization system protein ParE